MMLGKPAGFAFSRARHLGKTGAVQGTTGGQVDVSPDRLVDH